MPEESQRKDTTALKQVVAAAGGAVLSLLMFVLSDIVPHQQSVFSPTGPPRMPPRLELLSRVSGLMASFPFKFIAFAGFAVLAVVWRREERAWIYALFAGMGIPFVVFHLLKLV